MRRTMLIAVDVLDPELWDDPDHLTAAEGHAQFGLDPLGDRPAADTEDFQ
jgi:hypothetical protein